MCLIIFIYIYIYIYIYNVCTSVCVDEVLIFLVSLAQMHGPFQQQHKPRLSSLRWARGGRRGVRVGAWAGGRGGGEEGGREGVGV